MVNAQLGILNKYISKELHALYKLYIYTFLITIYLLLCIYMSKESFCLLFNIYITTQQYTASLQSPAPINPNEENVCTSDPTLMNTYGQQYYQMLYSVDTVEPTEIINYLDGINFDRILSAHDAESLEADIFLDELMAQTNRVKKSSSPGVNGLGYPFLALLFRMPCLKQIMLNVCNDALKGIIPSSWQDIRVRLLPKKGDLSSLKNWRPIS